MFKSSLLELILSTSGAKAGMHQIESSGTHFVDFWSQARLENAEIYPSGAHFFNFWSQGLKMLKSTLLELILSTSGAKA